MSRTTVSPRCPHCGGRRSTWGREAILEAIQAWADEHGQPPTAEDWRRSTPHSPASTQVIQMFGGWNNGLRAAGQETVRPGGRRTPAWTRERVGRAFYEWTYTHGRVPRFADWARTDPEGERPTSSQVQRLFGSWNAGLVAAGYEPVTAHRTLDGYRRQSGATLRNAPSGAPVIAATGGWIE